MLNNLHVVVLLCGLLANAVYAGSQHNNATLKTFDIDIQALNAAKALNKLADQTDSVLLFPYKDATARQANAVVGRYTLTEALSMLLEGSGLSGDLSQNGVIRISVVENKHQQCEREERESMTKNRSVIAAAMAFLFSSAAVSQPVSAQGQRSAANNKVALEEIIVTAQKREQSLQDVPVSINVLDGDSFAASGVMTGFDAVAYIPGMAIQESQEVRTTQVRTRGIGTFTNNIGIQNSTQVYFDGVVIARMAALAGGVMELERVEAMRGPQGTLFGMNASAGLIHYISKKPLMGEFEGSLHLRVAEYGERNIDAMLNIPLADSWAARLNITSKHADGYLENTAYSDNDMGEDDSEGFRVQLAYDSDKLQALLRVDANSRETNCCDYSLISAPSLTANNGIFAAFPVRFDKNKPTVSTNKSQFANVDNKGVALELSYDVFEGHSLTYLAAWRDFELENNTDFYSTPIDNTNWFWGGDEKAETLQHELRLSSYDNQRLNYTLGLFYWNQDGYSNKKNDRCYPANVFVENVDPTTLALTRCASGSYDGPPIRRVSYDESAMDVTNTAIFGQLEYNITDDLLMLLGGRYLEEQTDASARVERYAIDPSGNGTAPLWDSSNTLSSVSTLDNQGHTVDEFIYKLGLTYTINEDVSVFTTYTTGFKGVAFVVNGNTDPQDIEDGRVPTDPENSKSVELGLRSQLLDNRLTLNATAFYTEIEGFQRRSSEILSYDPFTIVQRMLNAGLLVSKGVEVDFSFLATAGLTFNGGIAYADAVYDDFSNALARCPGGQLAAQCFNPDPSGTSTTLFYDESGDKVENYSDLQIYLSGNYTHVLSQDLEGFVRMDFRYMSDTTATIRDRANGVKGTPSYNISDLYVGVNYLDRYNVQLSVKNVFDQNYYTTTFYDNATSHATGAYFLRDYTRYFGVDFTMTF